MRRFSSEGSLLDLDFLPWKKFAPKNPGCERRPESAIYTLQTEADQRDGGLVRMTPTILEPEGSPGTTTRKNLTRERSVSTENLSERSKADQNRLAVGVIREGCRAYSDGQLAADSTDGEDQAPPSPSGTSTSKLQHKHQNHRARLAAAKLHFKSLFGQSPHSSHSNLTNTEHKDSDSYSERRSRLLFMRQWSQVGHSKTRVGRDELEAWAQSLNDLLASQIGVSVFGAFLRSEFSEENLQFYMACEQYKHSSNNFSLRRRAKDICATYIQPGAPREVNLDSKTRDLTIQLLQAPSATSLALAQKRIYSLLDLDCYPRFLQSSVYSSLLQEAD